MAGFSFFFLLSYKRMSPREDGRVPALLPSGGVVLPVQLCEGLQAGQGPQVVQSQR